MSRRTRDGTAEPVSRDDILSRERGHGNIHFPCSADRVQIGNHTRLIQNLAICVTIHTYIHASRALSLRHHNLVSGYECGIVFPAGGGPGSSLRDAANWLPLRFSRSVETRRRRYDWLRMMFPGARLFRAPIWCPSGGVVARERQGALLSRRAW